MILAKAATWDGQAEHSVVSKEENQKAIKYLEQVVPDVLENLPFLIENLTLEKPQGEQNYEAFSSANLRQAKKWYTVDMYQKRFCIPQTSRAHWSIANAGGYGTGGYWWTLFRATENTVGKTKNIWLSA